MSHQVSIINHRSSNARRPLLAGYTPLSRESGTTSVVIVYLQVQAPAVTRWGDVSDVNHQSSIINHQSSIISHQVSIINHRSSNARRPLLAGYTPLSRESGTTSVVIVYLQVQAPAVTRWGDVSDVNHQSPNINHQP